MLLRFSREVIRMSFLLMPAMCKKIWVLTALPQIYLSRIRINGDLHRLRFRLTLMELVTPRISLITTLRLGVIPLPSSSPIPAPTKLTATRIWFGDVGILISLNQLILWLRSQDPKTMNWSLLLRGMTVLMPVLATTRFMLVKDVIAWMENLATIIFMAALTMEIPMVMCCRPATMWCLILS